MSLDPMTPLPPQSPWSDSELQTNYFNISNPICWSSKAWIFHLDHQDHPIDIWDHQLQGEAPI